MKYPNNYLLPDRSGFDKDPFGYSSLARIKWGVAATTAGFPIDISKPASGDELKNPVLWLSHAHALSTAAVSVILNEPEFLEMPVNVRGICDSQYCAVGLMLVGYSLEICLKSMIIIREGINEYNKIEKQNKHHRLQKLAEFIPDLTEKDKVILQLLTHFVYWAGKYPDPGSGKEQNVEEIFRLSETHQVSAHDLFTLSSKVMNHSKNVIRAAA